MGSRNNADGFTFMHVPSFSTIFHVRCSPSSLVYTKAQRKK